MSKNIRVYELARELDVKSKDVLRILQDEMNLEIHNHMSTINDNVARRVRQLLGSDEVDADEPAAPPAKAKDRPKQAEAQRARAGGAEEHHPQGRDRERSRQRRREANSRQEAEKRSAPAAAMTDRGGGRVIRMSGPLTVGRLAQELGITPAQAVQKLVGMGVMASVSQELDQDTAILLAAEFGATLDVRGDQDQVDLSDEALLAEQPADAPDDLKPRPPVVTVLGHVDHGKTTLLDAIRETNVAAGEAGGITQHIGASTVRWNGQRIIFLDTPGHEAFTQMRARGAQVTDIAVLVVAADDGVMPQTVEAINHAKAAGVPIIVAINKIDKPGANPERVKQQLVEHNLVPEDWGGDTICVPVSALQKQGIDELLEMILLVAEVSELKANPNRPAVGTVIESRLDKGRGPVATVLVQRGTLRRGDAFVVGMTWGRVRAILDEKGKPLNDAGPSTPVEVLGFQDVPQAGDRLIVLPDEKRCRELAARRQELQRQHDRKMSRTITLEEVYRRAKAGEVSELSVIIKADTQGSLEAVRDSVLRLGTEEVRVQVIHGAVGAITESDVMLASASGAVILGFGVRPDANARRAAETERVEIRTYRVIYELLDDVRKALEGLLAPHIEEEELGRVEVRATFRVPGVGTVAGCYVVQGVVRRDAKVRLIRDGKIIYEGKIASLKRFQDDVREVREGFECGIALERFQDVKEGDLLEVYTEREVQRTLEG